MQDDVERILLEAGQIHARVRELAGEISAVYENSDTGLTLVPILSGSIIFLADLIRELPMKMRLALIHISTYPGATTRAKEPRTVMELTGNIADRDVLLVDDILDSGRTLARVRSMILERRPRSLRTAVLLRKPFHGMRPVEADFVGFDIEDLFVVGYGLDFDDHYRNLPHIAVLRSELMT